MKLLEKVGLIFILLGQIVLGVFASIAGCLALGGVIIAGIFLVMAGSIFMGWLLWIILGAFGVHISFLACFAMWFVGIYLLKLIFGGKDETSTDTE